MLFDVLQMHLYIGKFLAVIAYFKILYAIDVFNMYKFKLDYVKMVEKAHTAIFRILVMTKKIN